MTDEESLYAGVDGGGSKTLAVIVDATGQERGWGAAGSANVTSRGLDRSIVEVHNALVAAADMAGCTLPLQAAWIGLAGVDRVLDHTATLPRLQGLAHTVQLTNDAALVLGGLENAQGVALIAGTGSIALGRDALGVTARAGGWGYALGDEGSGYALGHAGLIAATRAADGRGPATSLLDRILQAWQLQDPRHIIERVYPHADIGMVARLAPLVLAAAQNGDTIAGDIVARGADELALVALTTGDKLHYPDVLPLAMAGGLLTHEPTYRGMVVERLARRRALGEVVVVPRPAVAAALAARWLPEARNLGEGC